MLRVRTVRNSCLLSFCCTVIQDPWIAGHLRLPSSTEIVLEYIVERKRLDDLASSIMDRRFQEQKVCTAFLFHAENLFKEKCTLLLHLSCIQYRLKHCGIVHPTYLVEEQADLSYCSLAPSALQQAITNTQVTWKGWGQEMLGCLGLCCKHGCSFLRSKMVFS